MTDPTGAPAAPTFSFTVETPGERLDKLLAAQLDEVSRTQLQALIKSGLVRVDGETVKPSYRVEGGETVDVWVPEPEPADILAEALPLDILYEDDDLAAINKPAGMVVHPAYGHTTGTLVNALLHRWPDVIKVGGERRWGIVHRLDKDTSGVIVIAKTPVAYFSLTEQFAERATQKRYLALVEGHPATATGIVDAPIGRDPRQRKKMAVVQYGREAITEYRVLEFYAEHALLELFPKTGRTHQIRVHMAFIHCPLVGDNVYGYRKQRIKLKRHFLHAADLAITSPGTGDRLRFSAPLPVGLQNTLDKLPR